MSSNASQPLLPAERPPDFRATPPGRWYTRVRAGLTKRQHGWPAPS
jgi:hypothetical protein